MACQIALGVAVPFLVATAWVVIEMEGLALLREPTPTERAWKIAGWITGVLGYLVLAVSCAVFRKRYPVYAVVGALAGAAMLVIQLIDRFD